MARILIYDSEGTADSGENVIEMSLILNQFRATRPIRAHGGLKGDQRNISYEFVLSGDPTGAVSFQWYQEFFNDHPWVNLGSSLPAGFRQIFTPGVIPTKYPTERVFPGSGSTYPWAREQVAIAGAAGVIDHYNAVRNIANMTVPAAGGADCRYFPMLVHTLWVRLQVACTTAEPEGGYPRFRIYAHGGGLTDVEAYTEHIPDVFDWNVPTSG